MSDAAAMNSDKDHGPDIDKFVEIIGAIWPNATAYPPGARFRVRNCDRLGYPIPNDMRGRTGTVVAVDGPVTLGDGLASRLADTRELDAVRLCDVARLLGLEIEMIHVVSYDDEPDTNVRMSHTWMESESSPPQADVGWLNERPSERTGREV